MSITAITSESKDLESPYCEDSGGWESYTIIPPVTGEILRPFQGISILLLSRRGYPFFREQLSKILLFHPVEVLCVFTARELLGEPLHSIPGCKSILVPPGLTPGEQINIGIQEAKGSHVFVLWDDMDLQHPALTVHHFEQVARMECLCLTPVLMNHRKESIPARLIPCMEEGPLEIRTAGLSSEGQPSLYPFDYCGIYKRDKFLLCEGYDSRISSSYWQKADFGFRTGLWGEQCLCTTGLRVAYQRDVPGETIPIDASYRRFFLKNLALKSTKEGWQLSKGEFLRFHLHSGMSLFASAKEYQVLASWVRKNKYRFKKDIWDLMQDWESLE